MNGAWRVWVVIIALEAVRHRRLSFMAKKFDQAEQTLRRDYLRLDRRLTTVADDLAAFVRMERRHVRVERRLNGADQTGPHHRMN